MKKLIAFCFSLFIVVHSYAIDPKSGLEESGFGSVVSGLAVDQRNRLISGFYQWSNMAMPGRSYHADCLILFFGKYTDQGSYKLSAIDAKSMAPKPVEGQLFFDGWNQFSKKTPAEQSFRLKLLKNIDSCSDDIDATDNEFQMSIQKPGDWDMITAIRVKKAFFYGEPDDLHKRKSYLIRGDLVFVIDQSDNWFRVKFSGKNGETLGWIKKSDVFQLQ